MRRTTFALLLCASLPFASVAQAGDRALAESLFRQGRALMDSGEYAEACPRLSESFTQDPQTGTLLALALCQEKLGKTASAWANYVEVASRSRREGRADREQAARERAKTLEATLSRLTIEVDPGTAAVPGLVVTRDGQMIGRGAWGASTPVDPGDHTVEAKAPGKEPWSTTVTIGAASDSKTVGVPALADAPAVETGAAIPPSDAVDTDASTEGTPFFTGSPLQTAGLIVGGAGIVGLGVGAFFGLRASSLNSDSNSDGHCDANSECDAFGFAKRNDAIDASNVATVALITGAGLTAVGATLFLVGRGSGGDTARINATPAVGPGVAAVSVQGRF